MAARSSSGRLIKQNSKYGEIQGRTFERFVQKMVGPDPLSDEEEYWGPESTPADDATFPEPEPSSEHSAGPDLGQDDVCWCLVCWSPCSPAPAAAAAYNRLNAFLAGRPDSPVHTIVGALGLELDAAAKYELLCQSCAALVRELEEREQQVSELQQQLLQRFASSQQQQQQQREDSQQQEKALHTMRAEGQTGMFGIFGLGLPLPAPPQPSASRSVFREEDTVEAYLSRRDEWITQTPGAAVALVEAMVDASSEGLSARASVAEETHPCDECERVFGSAEALARHEYFQHQQGELPQAEGEKEEAAVALEVVVERPALPPKTGAARPVEEADTPGPRRRGRPRLHNSEPLRSGTCQYCGTFIKVDLQGHINRFHTMVRPHQCDACGQKFVSRHSLAEHRQVAHGAGRPCPHCGATFARKKQLSMHMWRKHGVGGVQCRVCGKKFARSDTLDGHMRCHERPMQCSLCPARYPFKRELRNHEFLKHGLHGEIPRDSDYRPGEMYRCGKCGRCFGSWAGRDRHSCHSEAALSDLYVCQLCGDWSTRFEGDMVKHMRNLHKIEVETILIADVDQTEAAVGEEESAEGGQEAAEGGGGRRRKAAEGEVVDGSETAGVTVPLGRPRE